MPDFSYSDSVNRLQTVCLVFILLFLWHGQAAGSVSEILTEADKALAAGDLPKAEVLYTRALGQDPDNYRILRALGEVKMSLGKYSDAETLFGKVLAMDVTLQRKVLVYLDGVEEPVEAELVDEKVMPADTGKNNMRNYLDLNKSEPIPNYRLFFIKEGKMHLIPHNRARISYVGVPRMIHSEVQELYNEARNKLMSKSAPGKGVEMVELKGGCFQMGSNQGALDERPAHEVCVSPFKIDKTEVTQQAFQSKMNSNPSRFNGARNPVEMVTWLEANEYCRKSGKRLPTEAEWEFAARGGTTTEFYWGNDYDPGKGNFCDVSCELNIRAREGSDGFKYTAPVGSFPPNPYGLLDMAGNVDEWVNDWMEEGYYHMRIKDNPKGPVRDEKRVIVGGNNRKTIRGGGWDTSYGTMRSSSRRGLEVDYRLEGIGFRCAADLQ